LRTSTRERIYCNGLAERVVHPDVRSLAAALTFRLHTYARHEQRHDFLLLLPVVRALDFLDALLKLREYRGGLGHVRLVGVRERRLAVERLHELPELVALTGDGVELVLDLGDTQAVAAVEGEDALSLSVLFRHVP
jgi:hypothetical protein